MKSINEICLEIINDYELQEKFINFDENKSIFVLDPSYTKRKYMNEFKTILKQEIASMADKGIVDISTLMKYSYFLFEKDIEDYPYLIDFNIISETIEDLKLELGALANSDEENESNVEEAKRLLDNLTELSINFQYYLGNYNINDLYEIIDSYRESMNKKEELSFDETEELAYLCRSGAIDESEIRKFLEYTFKSIIENHYKIDNVCYRSLFVKLAQCIAKDKKLDTQIYLSTFKGNTEGECCIYESEGKEKKTIYLNIEDLTPKNYIDNFETLFHELRHVYQSQMNDYSSLLMAKDLMLERKKGEKKYKKDNYINLIKERDAFRKGQDEAEEFLLKLCPKQEEEIRKEMDYSRTYTKKAQLDNELFRIEQGKRLKRIRNLNIKFDDFVKNNSKYFFDQLSKRVNIYGALLYEYDLMGNKKSIIELLHDRADSLEAYENDDEWTKNIYEIYNMLLYAREDSLSYIIGNIKEIYSSSDVYRKEALTILKVKLKQYIINNRDTIKANIPFAISEIRKEIIKKLKKYGDIKRFIKEELELMKVAKETPDLVEQALSELENENIENIDLDQAEDFEDLEFENNSKSL